jgi:hypothetical protein
VHLLVCNTQCNKLSIKCAFIKYTQLELKLNRVFGSILWHGVDMGEVQKLILFPATNVQVSALETGVKANWELDQLPLENQKSYSQSGSSSCTKGLREIKSSVFMSFPFVIPFS